MKASHRVFFVMLTVVAASIGTQQAISRFRQLAELQDRVVALEARVSSLNAPRMVPAESGK
jgi:hypothetical protein